ncbi:MAG: DHH family phosphoesterase [Halorientalis sp.]
MVSRLVVGCGPVGASLVETLSARPGDLLVLDDSERRVRRLRERGVSASQADVTDRESLADAADAPSSLVVAGADPATNLAAAEVAREAFPEALLVAYAGDDPDPDHLDGLRSLADDVIDPAAVTTDYVMERAGDAGIQVRKLRRAFWNLSEPLAIVTHDNPDPDAIASAVSLARIADSFDVEADVCYYGEITHQENRAFVNLLEFDLTQLGPDADTEKYGGFALVDHSRPGVNDQLPPDTPVDIVIDHHPPRAPIEGKFVDLRSDVGATSTLLVEYLQALGIDLDEQVATALLFGIRVDTDDFTREASPADFEAAAAVVPLANFGTLERIESPSVSGDTFETIASAIRNRRQRGQVLTSCVGDLPDRDSLAQAADRLLGMEGVTTTVVYGIREGTIFISGRARGADIDLGETLRDAFAPIGSAGGHADMAGAQIEVTDTVLDPTTDPDFDEQAEEVELSAETVAGDLETFIEDRFFDALDARPRRERRGVATDSASAFPLDGGE